MWSQPGGENEAEDKKQMLLRYVFWMVVTIILGYIVLIVL
ncbi:hypothetical protein SAMN05216226_101296 [Halovenus aranensis]|uniref:Uncharacterized protein n=1 Tax=Halovenus aranensis TaxID=890420 RepID=A0A1G8S710_9EURY|nr:hypothetical protein SAMN05216226_101296 [Halovenus aranensis]